MRGKTFAPLLAAVVSSVSSVHAASAQSIEYAPTDITHRNEWLALGPNGELLGHQESEDETSGVIWMPGGPTELLADEGYDVSFLGGVGYDSNGTRIAVGSVYDSGDGYNDRGAVWRDGIFQVVVVEGTVWNRIDTISADGSTAVGRAGTDETTYAVYYDCSGNSCLGFDLESVPGMTEAGATDVSGDGSVIIGWAKGELQNGAVIWNRDASPQGYDFSWLADPEGDLGSTHITTANGVSADGKVVVGGISLDGDFDMHALRWIDNEAEFLDELGGTQSEAFATTADGSRIVGYIRSGGINSASRWNADGEAELLEDVLTGNGVDLGELSLERATDITPDGSLVLGHGFLACEGNCRPESTVWLMHDEAIVTMADMTESFGAVGQTAVAANRLTDRNAQTHEDVAFRQPEESGGGAALAYGPGPQDIRAFDSFDAGPSRPWRWYGSVHAEGGDGTAAARGKLGLAYMFSPEVSVGIDGGFERSRVETMFGGKTVLDSWSASAFAARSPKTGLQALLSATIAIHDAEIARGYLNGITPVTSSGETDGTTIGMHGRLGWRLAAGSRSAVTPFAALTVSHSRFDGYSEADGPMPASFGDFSTQSTVTRFGVEAETRLDSGTLLWASAAWAHRFGGGSPAVTGTLAGSLALQTGAPDTENDWFEISAGTAFGLADGMALGIAVETRVSSEGSASGGLRATASRAF